MSSLKSIVGLALVGLLLVETGHAQESDDCPYPKGREIQDLETALMSHEEWFERRGWVPPALSGRANFCNADLSGANLSGANLERANLERAILEGADLNGANLQGANLRGANLQGAENFLTLCSIVQGMAVIVILLLEILRSNGL